MKYGLKDSPYQLVISENQKGGQNGFIITNNYAPNSRVVHGNNYGVVGDVKIETLPSDRHVTDYDKQRLFSRLDKNKDIYVNICMRYSESVEYGKEILNTLSHNGYTNLVINFFGNTTRMIDNKDRRLEILGDDIIYIHCQ